MINLIHNNENMLLSQKNILDHSDFAIDNQTKLEINLKINEARNAFGRAGSSILLVAKLLSEIKCLLKNKNWIKFTDDEISFISGRVARDLASAYESWLGKSSIPPSALAQVSARTLAKIGKADPCVRVEVENHLKLGRKCTENDLSYFIKKSYKTTIDEEIRDKNLISINDMSDIVKLEKFKKILIENNKLRKKVKTLEKQILVLKKKLSIN